MPEPTTFQRYPTLVFSKLGPIWRCAHRDRSKGWPVILLARDVYYGTGRLLARLSLERDDDGIPIHQRRILTGRVDLLIHSQRKNFSKEAAERIARGQGEGGDKLAPSIETMLDAMLERLTEAEGEVVEIDLFDVPLPEDRTPRYAVWPVVPVMRPGMIVAASGSGKSTLAGGIALSVSHGVEVVPDIEPRLIGPVIYIGQEEDVIQMRMRIDMMARGHGVTFKKERLIYQRLPGGSLIESEERIAEKIALHRAALLIIDSAQATWGNDSDSVREYTSKWFSSVERLGVPVLIIEHPNLQGTKKPGQFLNAAGSSVKQDRAGHVWSVNSIEMPVRPGSPYKYHVTMRDTKRNYVGRQPDIIYETIVHGYEWLQFKPAEELTGESIVETSLMWAAITAVTREPDEEHEETGYTVEELAERLKKSERRVRGEMLDVWREHPHNPELEEKMLKVEGTGVGRGNPAYYKLISRRIADPVQLSILPGGQQDQPS